MRRRPAPDAPRRAPRLLTAATLALALLAPAAHAKTYWVSPYGVAGRSGADSLANATTLRWFNDYAAPGDICRFRTGRYADPIRPANDGTPAKRIRYYGFPHAPGAVTVADIRFGWQHGSWCTARGFHTEHGITGCDGVSGVFVRGDSIADCVTEHGDGGLLVRGKDCVFDRLVMRGSITGTGQTHWIDSFIGGNPAPWFASGNTVSNCRFDVFVQTVAGQGDVHVVGIGHGVENRYVNNRFDIHVDHCQGYFFAVELYEGYRNVFERNTWDIRLAGPIRGSRGVWSHRDSSSYNRWIGNTVSVTGHGGPLSFMLSNGGSWSGTTGHNLYRGNQVRDDVPQAGTGVFWFYDGSRHDTLEANAITTSSSAPCVTFERRQAIDGSVFRGNKYRTNGLVTFDASRAIALNGPRSEDETHESMLGQKWLAARLPQGFVMSAGTRSQKPRK